MRYCNVERMSLLFFQIISRPLCSAGAGRGSLLHTKDAPHFLLMTFPRESRKMLAVPASATTKTHLHILN